MQAQGETVADEKIAFLREQYGLDQPMWQQYLVWATGLLHGDLGYSFEYNQPVAELIGERMWLTILLNAATILFIYVVVVPDRRLLRHAPVQLDATRACPSSASSASRRRTSCWR